MFARTNIIRNYAYMPPLHVQMPRVPSVLLCFVRYSIPASSTAARLPCGSCGFQLSAPVDRAGRKAPKHSIKIQAGASLIEQASV